MLRGAFPIRSRKRRRMSAAPFHLASSSPREQRNAVAAGWPLSLRDARTVEQLCPLPSASASPSRRHRLAAKISGQDRPPAAFENSETSSPRRSTCRQFFFVFRRNAAQEQAPNPPSRITESETERAMPGSSSFGLGTRPTPARQNSSSGKT